MAVPDLDFTDIINNSPEDNSSGYFKELMQSVNSYINEEFIQGRIVGTEYANVYLGAMQYAMQQAVGFAMQEHINNEQAGLIEQQKLNAQSEALNIPKQGALLDAQSGLTEQQITNAEAEALNIPKQGSLIDAQTGIAEQQKLNAQAEALNIPKQGNLLDAQVGLTEQQEINAKAEALNVPKQGSLLDAQAALTTSKNTTETKQQSVLDNQANLYDTQASAFKYRHNKDLAKVIADTWLVGIEGTVSGDYVANINDTVVAGEKLSTALSNAVWV